MGERVGDLGGGAGGALGEGLGPVKGTPAVAVVRPPPDLGVRRHAAVVDALEPALSCCGGGHGLLVAVLATAAASTGARSDTVAL